MDDSGWNWINIDAEKKKGWKMDGDGNIEHAWNDYIRMDEQGLNRIKLDGGKQWIMNGKWIEIMDIYIYIYYFIQYNEYITALLCRTET